MTKPYLISFKPSGNYYFGSSRSFAEGFCAQSLRFPTQLTLLGCIRRTILKQQGLLDDNLRYPQDRNGKTFKDLTGDANGNPALNGTADLGRIKRISQVFIARWADDENRIDDFLFPVPNDVCISHETLQLVIKCPAENSGWHCHNALDYASNAIKPNVFFSDRENKSRHAEYLGGKKFWNAYLKGNQPEYSTDCEIDKIIKKCSQTGIARENRKSVDNAYYIKRSFHLIKKHTFGIIVHLDDKILDNDDVMLGGERCLFRMKIIPIEDNCCSEAFSHPLINRFVNYSDQGDFSLFNPLKENPADMIKIVCLSPCIYTEPLTGLEHAMIGEPYKIRYLNKLKTKGQNLKSDTVLMLPTGSILYPDDKFKFDDTGYDMAKTIGYNFAFAIKKGR